MKETFLPIIGYEGIYAVSNLGNVKSLTRPASHPFKKFINGRILKLNFVTKKGYLGVDLYKEGVRKSKRVHILVATAFIPNIENKPEVNHKNAIKTDNRVENLEWATSLENQLHSIQNGLRPEFSGEKNGRAKLNKSDVINIRSSDKSLLELSELYNISKSHIYKILKYKTWNKSF